MFALSVALFRRLIESVGQAQSQIARLPRKHYITREIDSNNVRVERNFRLMVSHEVTKLDQVQGVQANVLTAAQDTLTAATEKAASAQESVSALQAALSALQAKVDDITPENLSQAVNKHIIF